MSLDEIRAAIANRHSIAPEHVNAKDLVQCGCMPRVFLLHEDYQLRMSYLADVLVQSVTSQPKDVKLKLFTSTLAMSLSYLMNSASWREGELFEFDADEIRRKLARIGVDDGGQ